MTVWSSSPNDVALGPLDDPSPRAASFFALENQISGLRRRLFVERGLFTLVLLGVTTTWAYPTLFPKVWIVNVGGKPVVALRDRASAEMVLQRLKDEQTDGRGEEASFALPVTIAAGRPDRLPVTNIEGAVRELAPKVEVDAPKAVIYVNNIPVAAVDDERVANRALSELKMNACEGIDLNTAPRYEQQVSIRREKVARDLWCKDAEEAMHVLTQGRQAAEGAHTIAKGETAWAIAQQYGLRVQELAALNPGVNMHRLIMGQSLSVKSAVAPPLTVVAEAVETEERVLNFTTEVRQSPTMYQGKRILVQDGKPGREEVKWRILYKNGKPAGRQAVARRVIEAPRTKVVIRGAKTRPHKA